MRTFYLRLQKGLFFLIALFLVFLGGANFAGAALIRTDGSSDNPITLQEYGLGGCGGGRSLCMFVDYHLSSTGNSFFDFSPNERIGIKTEVSTYAWYVSWPKYNMKATINGVTKEIVDYRDPNTTYNTGLYGLTKVYSHSKETYFTVESSPGNYSAIFSSKTGIEMATQIESSITINYTVACPSGKTWSGSSCQLDPTVTLSGPSSVLFETSPSLTWTSTNSDTCTKSITTGAPDSTWSNNTLKNGSNVAVNAITTATTYQIICKRNSTGATATKSITVEVTNGTCGPNDKQYTAGATDYPSKTNADFCATGTASPSPSSVSFPSQGANVSWTCSGTTCTVSRNSDGACSSAATNYGSTVNTYNTTSMCSVGTAYNASHTSTITTLPTFPSSGSSSFWTCKGTSNVYTPCEATKEAVSAPTVNLVATPSTVVSGGTTNLTWTSTNTTGTCTSSGDWANTTRALNNATGVVPLALTSDKTYTLTCENSAGVKVSDSVTVTVIVVNADCGTAAKTYPGTDTAYSGSACSFGTTGSLPTFPPIGGSSTWTCSGSGGGSTVTCTAIRNAISCGGVVPSNATAYNGTNLTGLTSATSYSYAAPNSSAKCEFSCNSGYSWSGSACVAAPTVDIVATPLTVASGGSTTLTWTSTNTTKCDSTGDWANIGRASSNTVGFTPNPLTSDKTYTLTCENSAGVKVSDSVTVTVLHDGLCDYSNPAIPGRCIYGTPVSLTNSLTEYLWMCVGSSL